VADLVTIDDLPDDFEYPPEYIRVVELGLTNLEPWWIVQGQLLRDRFPGLQRGYPDRKLILFAVKEPERHADPLSDCTPALDAIVTSNLRTVG